MTATCSQQQDGRRGEGYGSVWYDGSMVVVVMVRNDANEIWARGREPSVLEGKIVHEYDDKSNTNKKRRTELETTNFVA